MLANSCVKPAQHFSLSGIAAEDLSPALCQIAVRCEGAELQYVPLALRTQKMCFLTLQDHEYKFEQTLSFIPKKFHTVNLYAYIIEEGDSLLIEGDSPVVLPANFPASLCSNRKKNGIYLGNLHPSVITPELCKIAVQQNGVALRSVPTHLRTRDMCDLAVKNNGHALAFVRACEKKQVLASKRYTHSASHTRLMPLRDKT